MENQANSLVTYDPATRELSSVPAAFAARHSAVNVISWRNTVDIGKLIAPGMELADIFWEDASPNKEVLHAPANCSGKIQSVNRAVRFDDLPRSPSQMLLRLA